MFRVTSLRGRIIFATAVVLSAATLSIGAGTGWTFVNATTSSASTGPLPCGIYSSGGTPCVAAFSTTRALYASYDGPLYQVKRASDGTSENIGLLSTGGSADAATQSSFCSGTTCTITEIYDQSGDNNNLTVEGPGQNGPQDFGSNASAVSLDVTGNPAYGVLIGGQTGYRLLGAGKNMATGGEPEGMYEVVSGTYYNDQCCFDFGNVESTESDDGAGTMDAINFGDISAGGQSPGPWVQADLENGIYTGAADNNPSIGNPAPFETAVLNNNGQTTYELRGGNAQDGGLTTFYNGPLPNGYSPMQQQGGIVLGTGGDNTDGAYGVFFEGAIVSGVPSDATTNAVQASIVDAGYSGDSGAGPGAPIIGPGGLCVSAGMNDSASIATPIVLNTCNSDDANQDWLDSTDNTIQTLGRCLDIINDGASTIGAKLQLYNCSGVEGQDWTVETNGTIVNQGGLCLDDPSGSTAVGTQLQVRTCDGSSAQQFSVSGGAPITLPGGQCVDTAGLDEPTNGEAEQVFTCQHYSADQHWQFHSSSGALTTVGNWDIPGTWCMSVAGNGTASGTAVELEQCSASSPASGQVWVIESNGTIVNPHSSLCLDDPGGNTSNGTGFEITTCSSASQEQFDLH